MTGIGIGAETQQARRRIKTLGASGGAGWLTHSVCMLMNGGFHPDGATADLLPCLRDESLLRCCGCVLPSCFFLVIASGKFLRAAPREAG